MNGVPDTNELAEAEEEEDILGGLEVLDAACGVGMMVELFSSLVDVLYFQGAYYFFAKV